MIKMNKLRETDRCSVAIVGIGCRFPGGVTNPDEFWSMLADKTDAISEVPADRWNFHKFFDASPEKPGSSYARWGGFLDENVFEFDPLFFGISPREAEAMDPQQRYVLKVAYEAIEDAGLTLQQLRGSQTGVFVGGFSLDNKLTQMHPDSRHLHDANSATSSTLSILANRLSYVFDFRGPCLALDTACSSSLVATHLAVRSIRSGDSEIALAGGVTIMTRPDYGISLCKGGYLSQHGRCKAFDAAAAGYTRGEGCGIVVLKPLHRAIADGDRIYSVIRNTGINQDGATPGIASPNGKSQVALMEQVYQEAGLSPAEIHYFEAHGTGTQAGDTTECAAINTVMSAHPRTQDLVVGSVKTNIGHLEAAAGVAGLIKASLMVQRGSVLPNIHFENPNPKIPFDKMALRVPTSNESWPVDEPIRRASVNSFGYGGTNAHAVVESFDPSESCSSSNPVLPEIVAQPESEAIVPSESGWLMLPVTAQDTTALQKLAASYAHYLKGLHSDAEFRDFLHSAGHRKSFHRHRTVIHGQSHEDLQAQLQALATGETVEQSWSGSIESDQTPQVVFVFTGMGPQWYGMGQSLYATEPVFRQFVDRADQLFREIAGWSIRAEMQRCEAESQMDKTEFAQPANFVLQAGLLELYAHYGVRPAIVIGHSVGEVAAAYASGALSLRDALRVSCYRSRFQATLAGTGGMLAAGISESQMAELLEDYDQVEIAAINSPASITIAGCEHQLQQIAERLDTQGSFQRMLQVEVPYHSAKMEPIREQLLTTLADLNPQTARVELYSTVTAGAIDGASLDANYWWQNVRQPVRFGAAIQQLAQDHPEALFFEIGPHPVLKTSIKQSVQAIGQSNLQAYSLHRKHAESLAMRQGIAQLFVAGVPLDWTLVNQSQGRFVKLPPYPWTMQEYRRMSAEVAEELFGNPGHLFFMEQMQSPRPTWEVEVNEHLMPWLPDHQVDQSVVLPAAAYVEAALAIAYHHCNLRNFSVQNVEFRNLLIDQRSVQTRLQSSYDPTTGDFAVHSRQVGERDSWSQHADGKIIAASVPALGAVEPSPQGQTLDTGEFYQRLAARGLVYGPNFQTVKTLKLTHANEVVAQLEQQACEDPKTPFFVLHPTMLDGAFQAMLALVKTAPDDDRTFVPTSIARIHVSGKLSASAYARCTITSTTDEAIVADISLANESGQIVVQLCGVRCQALAAQAAKDPYEDVFHNLKWEVDAEPQVTETPARSWLMIGDRELTDLCRHSQRIWEAEPIRLGNLESLSAACEAIERHPSLTDVVFLSAFHVPDSLDDQFILNEYRRLVELVQALIGRYPSEPINVHVITCDGHAVLPEDRAANLIGGTLNALGILLENEHPQLHFYFTDVPDADSLGALVNPILLAHEPPRERAYRNGQWYRASIMPTQLAASPPRTRWTDVHENAVGLELLESRNLDSLQLREVLLDEPGEGEVQIRLHSGSLNFKDSLKIYGKLADSVIKDTYLGSPLGCDVSGTVTKVGASVTGFAEGDQIMAIVPDAFRSHLNVRAEFAMLKPDGLSMEEASGILCPLTVWYGLIDKAGLQEGERVLIHHATGGIGSVAIQVARWRNAEIFATAGTEAKRQHLRSLGIRYVYDSRSLAFAEEIRRDTGGAGVDVVLNATADETLVQSFELLAPFGRFIEIGKKNIAENQRLPMRAFQDNLTFVSVDLDRLLRAKPKVAARLFQDVAAAFAEGVFQPVPIDVFPVTEAKAAFQKLARAKHVGKITLKFEGVQANVVQADQSSELVRRGGTYLVTGGTKGFGLEVAKWLAAQGAGKLVLVSRSGEADATRAAMPELLKYGSQIESLAVDIGCERQVKELVASIEDSALPLRGVFHAAVVLEDRFISQLSADSLERVLRPKLLGGVYLHQHTQSCPLDIFFCFSSISALIGNQGQTSYVLANAYLDALCHFRRSCGLPATSINWGPISDVGILSRKNDVADYFARYGLRNIRPSESGTIIQRVLEANVAQMGAFRVQWSDWAKGNPAITQPDFRFNQLLQTDASGAGMNELDALMKDFLAGLSQGQSVVEFVQEAVIQEISELLKIPPRQLDASTGINHMGIDSLAAVELGLNLRARLGVEFTPVQLMSGPSPTSMVTQIIGVFRGAGRITDAVESDRFDQLAESQLGASSSHAQRSRSQPV